MAVQAFKCTAILAGCDRLVPVHTFNHNTTTTSSVSLSAAIAETAYRLPLFCIVSIYCDLPLPFRSQVRQVVAS